MLSKLSYLSSNFALTLGYLNRASNNPALMRGFGHATILTPSFQGVRKEHLAQCPPFCDTKTTKQSGEYFQKNWEGCATRFLKLLPYFRPKSVIFPTLFQTWSKIWHPISDLKPWSVTSCYSTYTVVGVNFKWEMVLSPNDEEVANSSKRHTQFKTRVHKPYPISDQNG